MSEKQPYQESILLFNPDFGAFYFAHHNNFKCEANTQFRIQPKANINTFSFVKKKENLKIFIPFCIFFFPRVQDFWECT